MKPDNAQIPILDNNPLFCAELLTSASIPGPKLKEKIGKKRNL
jgi:hypothetical protein